MFQYQLDLGRIHGFIDKNPTLIQQRRKLAKDGKRFATEEDVEHFVGGAIQSAGQRFLERIHQEIWDSKPQWEKDAIEKERREDDPEGIPNDGRPELTPEYLRSIGYDPS